MDELNNTNLTSQDGGLPDDIDQSQQQIQNQPNFEQYQQQYQTIPTEEPVYDQMQYQNGTYYKQPKKKGIARIIALVAVFVVLIAGATTAYAFRGRLVNTVSQLTKSPAQYYAFIEKSNINVTKQSIKKYLDASTDNMGVKIKTDVNFNHDNINSLMKDNMGISLDDVEKQIGLPLKSFGINMLIGQTDDTINESLGIGLNQVDIISAELFMNNAAGKFFARIPELSDSYIDFSDILKSEGVDLKKFKRPSTDQTIDLITRYSDLIIKDVKDVKLDKNSKLKVDDLTKKCSKLTVTISNDDLYHMLKDILKEAKDDKYILNLLSAYNISKKDYQDEIKNQLDSLDENSDDLLKKDIIMKVYVDEKGAIIGRAFSSKGTDTVFSYAYLKDSNNSEYNLSINNDKGKALFDITGTQTKKNGAYDGSAEIAISDPNGNSSDEINIDVDYKDYRTEFKDNHYFNTGKITISSSDLLGIEITSDSSVANNTQKEVITIQAGGKTLATIDSSSEYIKDYKAEMPSKNSKTYGSSDLGGYISSIDVNAYIKKLSEKLGVDVISIYNNLMQLYGYNNLYN